MKKILVVLAVLVGIVVSGCVGEDADKMSKVYVADPGVQKIIILDDALSKLDEFSIEYSVSGWNDEVIVDGSFIYTESGVTGSRKLCKYNRGSPYGLVTSLSRSGLWREMDGDETYLYGAENVLGDGNEVYIHKKSDLSFVSKFVAAEAGKLRGVAVDDNYIYISSWTQVKKFNKDTHELATSITPEWTPLYELVVDDDYLYVISTDKVKILHKADLSLYKTISTGFTGDRSRGIDVLGDYVFISDWSFKQVKKVKISTDEVVGTYSDLTEAEGIAIETEVIDKEAPWKEDTLEPTGEVKVEIPRRSGEWTTLGNVMRIHTSNGKDTSSPRAPIEIGQAEVTCSNIDKDFNSFEEASDWYKNLEGYAIQIKVGCDIGGSPISVKLFTGIISAVDVDRLNLTAEIKVVDFLDYFGRVTIEETPVWESISLTQLFKNLVELAFTDWTHGVDYFVEDLGGSTIPAIGYTDLNLLSELKMIAESRGMRLYTDTSGRLHCASRNPEREPLTVSYDYNLEDVTERRNIDSIINWVEVHARPHEIQPDTTPPGKVSGFTATPGDQKIDLSWSNPIDDDFDKVRIVYSTSAYPTNEGEGTQIYEGTGISKSHAGLTNGTRYYYSAFTVDKTGNWSDAAHTSAVAGVGEDTWGDETETSPVTNFKAEAGHEKITLTWTNPKTADFSLVEIRWSTTDYPDSVTDGSQLYQGTAQTKVHSGLTIGTRYYYTAFAQNSGGEWSRGTHASAIPGLEGGGTDGEFREELATYSIRDSHCAWQDAKDYFSSWTYKKKFNFRIPYGRYTASWLRFKHRWDVKCYADMKYISNQKHVSGQKDDLTLNSTHDCNEIAICKTVYISLYSSAVSIFMEYTLSYKGGNIKEIHINNTLSLMG